MRESPEIHNWSEEVDDTGKLFIVLMYVNIVFMLIGLVCWKFDISRNHYIGFRTEKTLNNEQIWHKTNKRFGLQLSFIGLLMLMILAAAYINHADMAPVVIFSLVFFEQFLLLGSVIETFIWLNKQ